MNVELVSKELNHFGVIADLFRQIGGHSRFVILLFLKTFHYKNDKKCKSISIFFLKNNNKKIYFLLHKIQTPVINMQNVSSASSNTGSLSSGELDSTGKLSA